VDVAGAGAVQVPTPAPARSGDGERGRRGIRDRRAVALLGPALLAVMVYGPNRRGRSGDPRPVLVMPNQHTNTKMVGDAAAVSLAVAELLQGVGSGHRRCRHGRPCWSAVPVAAGRDVAARGVGDVPRLAGLTVSAMFRAAAVHVPQPAPRSQVQVGGREGLSDNRGARRVLDRVGRRKV